MRKVSFILASTDYGSMILNRFDANKISDTEGVYGVGVCMLENGHYDDNEIGLGTQILRLRRKHYGNGVIAIDGGANIGTHTMVWAKEMNGWGFVISIEAQERIYYALAGNIALNNLRNATALMAVISSTNGIFEVPVPDYDAFASFGGLSMKKPAMLDKQVIHARKPTQQLAIDSFKLPRLDLLKLDVEDMEMEALYGADETIERCRPAIQVEYLSDEAKEMRTVWLETRGYFVKGMTGGAVGGNLMAVHRDDKIYRDFRNLIIESEKQYAVVA